MASVYEKGGKWFLRFKDIDGVWVAKSSEARTKTEAKLLAQEIQRSVEQERIGLSKPGAQMTVRQLLDWWLDTYSSQLSSHDKNKHAVGRISEL